MRTVGLLISSMRPRQWAKNVFVLAPLLFAMRLPDVGADVRAALAVLLFCLAAGAVYLFNDVMDREADRQHPEKRHRPIASGLVRPGTASLAAAVAAAAAVGGALAWNLLLAGVVAAFLGLNLLYSLWGKHVPVLDVGMIAAGFLLRVVGGAVAIAVEISGWILLCTLLLSLYLGLGKRLHEMMVVEGTEGGTRRVLARYHRGVTVACFGGAGVLSVAAFAAYTLSERAVTHFGTWRLAWTVPLAAVGIVRYAFLAGDRTRGMPPTEALLSDPTILVTAGLWAAAAGWVIHG